MAQTARVVRATSDVASGEVVTAAALADAPVVEKNALEVKVATNATEVKLVSEAKVDVKVIGDLTISKPILAVLDKFSKKIKLPIEVIFFNALTFSELCRRPIAKDKFIILVPSGSELLTSSNSYATSLKDLASSSSENSSKDVACRFLADRFGQQLLMNTQFIPLFSDDGMNTHVAFAIKNEIVFHADLFSEKSDINDFLKKSVIISALKWYEIHDRDGALVKRCAFDKKILDNYIKFVRALQSNSKSTIRNQMNSYAEEIRGHFRAVQTLERKMTDAAALSASISRRITKNKHDTDPACVAKMIEPLLTQNKYKMFEFTPDGQSVIAYTHLIEIEHRGKKYKIGEFKVTVKLDGVVMMQNLTNRYNDGEGNGGDSYYDHPHVHDKFPCLGNIKEQVSEMIKNFNFLPLFDLLHTYLCTYMNEENARPFMGIRKWAPNILWCEPCDRPKADCVCRTQRCTRCDNPREDCECEKCPANGELMENVDCSSCDHQDDDGECRF